MNGKKLLKMAVGFLCVWFALLCALRIPVAIARLQQADNQSMTSVEAFGLYGAFAGVVLWSVVSFYLFRSARKDKRKPVA
jgi:multidrug transporter EmrE-like cation transporter